MHMGYYIQDHPILHCIMLILVMFNLPKGLKKQHIRLPIVLILISAFYK